MQSHARPDWMAELNGILPDSADAEPTLVQTQRLIDLVFGRIGDPGGGLPEPERAAAIEYYVRCAGAGWTPDRRIA